MHKKTRNWIWLREIIRYLKTQIRRKKTLRNEIGAVKLFLLLGTFVERNFIGVLGYCFEQCFGPFGTVFSLRIFGILGSLGMGIVFSVFFFFCATTLSQTILEPRVLMRFSFYATKFALMTGNCTDFGTTCKRFSVYATTLSQTGASYYEKHITFSIIIFKHISF